MLMDNFSPSFKNIQQVMTAYAQKLSKVFKPVAHNEIKRGLRTLRFWICVTRTTKAKLMLMGTSLLLSSVSHDVLCQ